HVPVPSFCRERTRPLGVSFPLSVSPLAVPQKLTRVLVIVVERAIRESVRCNLHWSFWMTDDDRFRLLFGPYVAPAFRYDDIVFCEVRGEVTIVGLSSGRIPWPIGKRGRSKSFAVYGGLADAIRREAAIAVCYWFGMTPQTVTKYRKALGVGEL